MSTEKELKRIADSVERIEGLLRAVLGQQSTSNVTPINGKFAIIDGGKSNMPANMRAVPVNGLNLAKLKELDVGEWHSAPFKGTKIPTLDQVLATVPKGSRFILRLNVVQKLSLI